MIPERATPELVAVTRPLKRVHDLVRLADGMHPLLWVRDGEGVVGLGEALRLSFDGPDRFARAADAWRNIAAAARVTDPMGQPGTGLVAFGVFSFADDSAERSVLIVPRRIIAQRGDSAWVTDITRLGEAADSGEDSSLAAPAGLGTWQGVRFAPDSAADDSSVTRYLAAVSEATARIERGDFEKIVISRQVRSAVDEAADLRVPLARLAERYPDCWTYAVDGMLGASPELLTRATADRFSGRVLAGTRGRHPDDPERDAAARDELLGSDKEQHEHEFAVQSVVTALSPLVRDLSTSERPFALQLPNVWHLATDLTAEIAADRSSLELAGALHPTAAVAGTPTAPAVAAIAQLEGFDRGRYSGAVGWIDQSGSGEWAIALRGAQVSEPDPSTAKRKVVATAGGGIVAGSDPSHELGETVSKLRPITEAFSD